MAIGMATRRPLRLAILIGLTLTFSLTSLAPSLLRAAEAQERRGLLDMLFGEPRQQRYYRDYPDPPRRVIRTQPRRKEVKPVRRPKQATRARAVPSPAVAPPQIVEKRDTAKTVLVIGDFMAGSLAGGLETSLSDNRDLKVVNAADGSSGLVRNDHYDWLAKIGPLIDQEKPAIVVAMLGSNERQAMAFAGTSLSPRTPGWIAEYERRAGALADAVAAKKVPLIWVGMPAFETEAMSADMAYLNEIYRKAASTAGGEYVDVWDGFVDAGGAFAFSGPDISGQPARLRNADGITMTPAGAEKLAFFAEKPIFRQLGTSVDGVALAAPDETLPKMPKVNAANATSTPLVALSDPSLDGGDALLGGPLRNEDAAQPSPRDRLVLSGIPTSAEPGRADAFNRGNPPAAAPASTSASASADQFRGSVADQKGPETSPPSSPTAGVIGTPDR